MSKKLKKKEKSVIFLNVHDLNEERKINFFMGIFIDFFDIITLEGCFQKGMSVSSHSSYTYVQFLYTYIHNYV